MTTTGPRNPFLDTLTKALADARDLESIRTEAQHRFGFAVPTPTAMAALETASPRGVIEIGAGTGYWAWYAHQHGIDVIATDPHPAPSRDSLWFADTPAWHPIIAADHSIVSDHPTRTLLIVWPTSKETWPVEALDLYADAGGECVVYVGEPPHGQTGDDAFHARLGEVPRCLQCSYGIVDSPCVCAYPAQWARTLRTELPRWPGLANDMYMYHRTPPRRWRHARGFRRR